MSNTKLTTDQTKAINAWLKKYGKRYINDRAGCDIDQIDQDCAYDLDLMDQSRAVAALCDKYINEAE